MKLIIDITEETYKEVIEGKDTSNTNIYTAIENGTPLDDVKAEIEKKCDRINSIASVLSYSQHREIQELLCEILASIGKAESEE